MRFLTTLVLDCDFVMIVRLWSGSGQVRLEWSSPGHDGDSRSKLFVSSQTSWPQCHPLLHHQPRHQPRRSQGLWYSATILPRQGEIRNISTRSEKIFHSSLIVWYHGRFLMMKQYLLVLGKYSTLIGWYKIILISDWSGLLMITGWWWSQRVAVCWPASTPEHWPRYSPRLSWELELWLWSCAEETLSTLRCWTPGDNKHNNHSILNIS